MEGKTPRELPVVITTDSLNMGITPFTFNCGITLLCNCNVTHKMALKNNTLLGKYFLLLGGVRSAINPCSSKWIWIFVIVNWKCMWIRPCFCFCLCKWTSSVCPLVFPPALCIVCFKSWALQAWDCFLFCLHSTEHYMILYSSWVHRFYWNIV